MEVTRWEPGFSADPRSPPTERERSEAALGLLGLGATTEVLGFTIDFLDFNWDSRISYDLLGFVTFD